MTAGASLRWVLLGQFIGALADNALLLIAVQMLLERHSPAWTTPALRVFFFLSIVLLSAHASAIADAWPKKNVVAAVNTLKLVGCALMLSGTSPLLAYALIGLGAAAHAPARYGLLTELSVSGGQLAANAWMEALTVLAMLLGTLWVSLMLQGLAILPYTASSNAMQGTFTLACAYLAATFCAIPVRAQAASDPRALRRPSVARHGG